MVGDGAYPEARHRAPLPSTVRTRQAPVGADARDLPAVDPQPPAGGVLGVYDREPRHGPIIREDGGFAPPKTTRGSAKTLRRRPPPPLVPPCVAGFMARFGRGSILFVVHRLEQQPGGPDDRHDDEVVRCQSSTSIHPESSTERKSVTRTSAASSNARPPALLVNLLRRRRTMRRAALVTRIIWALTSIPSREARPRHRRPALLPGPRRSVKGLRPLTARRLPGGEGT